MSARTLLVFVAIVAACVVSSGTSAPVPVPAKEVNWVGSRLQKTIDFPGIDDPKITLSEALEQLGKLGDVKIAINLKAFRQVGMPDVDKIEVALSRPVPAGKVKLGVILQELLNHEGSANAETGNELGFLLRGDRIEILPLATIHKEVWNITPGDETPQALMPLVHLRANERTLQDLLTDISEQTDLTVLLDPRCQEKAKQELTVRLVNAPADTAVEMLADMAGLELITQRNVLYVTSAENATRIKKEQERKLMLGMPMGFGPGGGFPGGGGLGGPGVPGGGAGGREGPQPDEKK